MVSYKLGIQNKKEARVLDLDRIIKLKDLESLDKFTSALNNEEELKMYLFNQGLISNDELNKNVIIMYKMNGKIKRLPVLYNDILRYLDFTNLKYELKGLSGNIEFLEKLARHYSLGNDKFNLQGLNVQDIRIYLSDVRNNDGKIFYSKSLEVALEDLFEKAIFKSIDKKTGEVKINYRGFRDLALLVYKYKNELEKKDEKNNQEIWEQVSIFETLSASESDYVDGKWILSSEGDPDFPPNSEEEANYLKYLEELEKKSLISIEEHDHYRR